MLKSLILHIQSMFTVFKHLFKRPVTLEYPEKKSKLPEKFRGKIFVSDCICCKTCMRVCPAGAILVKDDAVQIDMKKCIFCGNCMYHCPACAIKMLPDYELATDDKNELIISYNTKKNEVKENV